MNEPAPKRIVRHPSLEVIDEKYDTYVRHVGATAYAWNRLHERLRHLFVVVVNGEERTATAAIWYSSTSDQGQRRMLRAAIENSSPSRWPAFPTAKGEVAWILEQADKLAKVRNNAIHLPAALVVGGGDYEDAYMAPMFWDGNPKALKARSLNLLSDFKWCADCTDLLARYVADIETAMVSAARYGLPQRPELPRQPKPRIK